MQTITQTGETPERNVGNFEVVEGDCTTYFDEDFKIKDFKHKFTCEICGEDMLSNRSEATVCKRCIAEEIELETAGGILIKQESY